MTSARAESDLLMLIVSFSLSLFSPAPDVASRSLPARSTRLRVPSQLSPVSELKPLTLRAKTECDRDERSFMSVAATARRPRARSSRTETWRELDSGTGMSSIPICKLTADSVGHGHVIVLVNLDLVLFGVELAGTKQVVNLNMSFADSV